MNRTSLGPSKRVDCPCDPRFSHPILTATGDNIHVSGCLDCGAVSVVEAGVDEPRAGDIRVYDHLVIPVAADLLRWLAAWPRRMYLHWPESVFLPADWRCHTLEDLERDGREQLAIQAPLPVGRRIRLWSWPQTPPPNGLPPALRVFEVVWKLMQFTVDTPLATVVENADPRYLSAPFVYHLLLERADRERLIAEWLDDSARRNLAYTLLRQLRPPPAELVQAVLARLLAIPIFRSSDSSHRIERHAEAESTLDLLGDIVTDAPMLRRPLEDWKGRIGKRDWELVRKITETLAKVDAQKPQSAVTSERTFDVLPSQS